MSAFKEWKKIDGLTVLESHETTGYGENTLGAERRVLGALKPTDAGQISALVQIARAYRLPLYTLSTGRNWGYGSALPVNEDCVILDLGLMNRIRDFNAELGTVTVEPGVTQKQLHEYLSQRNLPFLVPTTGAGPTCSLLANALERGYGLTPHVDHFGAILGLKAVLADGAFYQSSLAENGGCRVDPVFKWNVGPYLDGLFAQGNFGIVTEATLSLAKKPDHILQFVAFIDDEHFEDAVLALRNLKQKLGSLLGGVNLMNQRRMLAMVEDAPVWPFDGVLPEAKVRDLAKKRKLPEWAMLGGIYVPNELKAGALEIIREELRPFATKTIFVGAREVSLLNRAVRILPLKDLARTLTGVTEALKILEGVPSRIALQLAYLKNRKAPAASEERSPDREACGLIWFSPLVPMDPALVRDFAREITRVCVREGMEPLITFTGISERCFDATIPLVFDLRSDLQRAKARRCYDALLSMAQEFGLFPYRMDVETLRKHYAANDGVAMRLTRTLKTAVDPEGILSPGRYT